MTYDASSCSSRTPRRLVVLSRSAMGIVASPILTAFADGSGTLVATFDDLLATDSARARHRRGRGDERGEARGRGRRPVADRSGGDEVLELRGGAHVERLVEDAVERAVDERCGPGRVT